MFLLKPLSLLADLVLVILAPPGGPDGVDRLVVAGPAGGSALEIIGDQSDSQLSPSLIRFLPDTLLPC